MSRFQKGKTNLDFTEARDSDWQWYQLGHMSCSKWFFCIQYTIPFTVHFKQQQVERWRGSGCRFFGAIGKRYKQFWMGSKAETDGVGI